MKMAFNECDRGVCVLGGLREERWAMEMAM
jgi:hypothetical protein